MIAANLDLVANADSSRHDAYQHLDSKTRGVMGQFMTPPAISQFMSSLFEPLPQKVKLLDPGAGVGTLSAAFFEKACQQGIKELILTVVELDLILVNYLHSAVDEMEKASKVEGIKFSTNILNTDFILDACDRLSQELFRKQLSFSHVIINPPYKKIHSKSNHRKQLSSIGIEASNLYSSFISLAINMLAPGGEIVAIVPRSFCNGPYFKSFRELLLGQAVFTRIHLFESRKKAFKEDDVLQENIIFHAIKGGQKADVIITTSPSADFYEDGAGAWVAEGMTRYSTSYDSIVNPSDSEQFIHISTSELGQRITDRLSTFEAKLSNLNIKVSTGPVVDFRMKDDWCCELEPNSTPLLYSHHFCGDRIIWPKATKKPNALLLTKSSRKWLFSNNGYFVVTKRLTSKEEKKRIIAYLYPSNLPGDLIGFENHLNIFHNNKQGFSKHFALGLLVYLNSTLVDQYFRNFNGHTQVNARDLRALPYPNSQCLESIGRKADGIRLDQIAVDYILRKEMKTMNTPGSDPVLAHNKIEDALAIITAMGLPKMQQNDRSALTLLALVNLSPEENWQNLERPLIGITPIMQFCRDVYGKEYAPNSRETFRRFTMHQFVDAGIVLYNPDKPDRPINSPKTCYQIVPDAMTVIRNFGTTHWETALKNFLDNRKTLTQQYAKHRAMAMIPVKVSDGREIKLSPGEHSELIRDIIIEFAPRFAPGSELIYIGETGKKVGFFQKDILKNLGVEIDIHGKMPDVVLYHKAKGWLILLEAVTSHGPVDSKRHDELLTLFHQANVGLVFVSAFPNRRIMARYLSDISWESEVWISSNPTHMIHFDGSRFLGPYQ